MVGVGEAVPDQRRANSLNTGWVKVPVKFLALAVVSSYLGLAVLDVTTAARTSNQIVSVPAEAEQL